jgi:hypothetical protein
MVGAALQLVVFVYRFILQGETDYISTNPLTTSSSSIIIKQQCISGQVLRATSKRAKPQGIQSRFERQYCATIIGACGLGMQQRAIPPVYHSFQASTSKSKWNSRPSQHSFLIENPILAVGPSKLILQSFPFPSYIHSPERSSPLPGKCRTVSRLKGNAAPELRRVANVILGFSGHDTGDHALQLHRTEVVGS